MQNNDQTWATQHTLIQRMLDSDDHLAWETFIKHYRPFIYFLLGQMRVSPDDQDDLAQEILLRLHKNLNVYVRDKAKFRTWLGAITRNTTLDFFDKKNRHTRKHNALAQRVELIEAHSETDFEKMVQTEWMHYLTEEALNRMRCIFSDNVVECFKMTMENRPVAEIAERLSIKKETVYTIRTRMKARVLQEVQELIRELEF